MTEPSDARSYLETLKAQEGQGPLSYSDFSRFLEHRARQKNVPLFGQFELTPLCNLSCRMCYVHLTPEQFSGHELVSVETWKDLMRQAVSDGMFEVALTGGECLTYPGFDELYLYLHSLGCQVTVMTNGVLLNQARIDFLKAHPPALVQVTLYGPNEDAYERVTGSRVFGRVMENLQRVKDAGFSLMISITPNRYLGEDVFETVRLARGLTNRVVINDSLFAPEDEPWRVKPGDDLDMEFYARILRLDRELRGRELREMPESELPEPGGPKHVCDECGLLCGGGRSSFVIDWKGEMRICNRLEARSFPLRDGFTEAWREINRVANEWPRIPECQGCAYDEVCHKCAARFMQYAEPGKQPKALCQRMRYMVSRGVLSMPQCEG